MATYLVIGVAGLLLLAVSLLAGDLLDGMFDALAGDWFSSAVIGGFVAAFGFGGALALGLGFPQLIALPIGIGSGLFFAWLAAWFTRLVKGGDTVGALESADLVGHSAVVLTDIPEDGYGTVRLSFGEHTIRLNARAEGVLPAGTETHVTAVLSPTAVTVAPVWDTTP